MKLLRVLLAALLACSLLQSPEALRAAEPSPAPAPPPSAPASSGPDLSLLERKAREMRLPGIGLADGISLVTGVAISPLLGVSAVGAWKYFQTPEQHRHLLPWFCQPWAWGAGLIILGSILVKDLFGTVDPTLLKKPFDFAELYEDKASALLALFAVVPFISAAMAEADAIPLQQAAALASPAELGLATLPSPMLADISWVKAVLYLPVLTVCFFVVWLSGHAINVLIALSPFGMVDAVLKAAKTGLMLVIAGASYLHPFLGLLVCIPVILVALMLSGWAFRFMVFGSVFGWDILLRRTAPAEKMQDGVRAFTARRHQSVPKRTFGTVTVNALGMHVFRHRPWLILPRRETVLEQPLDGIIDGVLHPSLTGPGPRGLPLPAFLLPPRYKKSTREVGQRLGITQFSDSGFKRTLGNVRLWFSEVLVMTPGPGPVPASGTDGPSTPPPMPPAP